MERTLEAPKGNLEISADYTTTKVILDELIHAHRNAPPSRERALLITKLQEARMWTSEAQAQE